jgi:hypothetical protein
MLTRSTFGVPSRALLNRELMAALRTSMPDCDACRDIEKMIESTSEGGEYVEAASFRGMSVSKLDAHFRAHWSRDYELVIIAGARGGR